MQTRGNNNGNTQPATPSNPGGSSGGSGGTTGGGSGGSVGGSGGGSGAAYYLAALLSTADSSNHGKISLDANGSGSAELQSAAASSMYSIQFCQFPNGNSSCFSVGSSTTDASGNAQSSFTFSRSGTWAGVFTLQPSGGGTGFTSSFPVPSSGTQYENPLQRAGTISGGLPSFLGSPGSDALSSGFVTIDGTVAHIAVNGAAPNASYVVGFCGNGDGSTCFADLGTVNTDASGNGSGDIDTHGRNLPCVFHLGRGNVLQFITGVHVP